MRDQFEEEVEGLLKRHFEFQGNLAATTSLRVMDSLGITEVCQLAEDIIGIELSYKEARACETFADLQALIKGKRSC